MDGESRLTSAPAAAVLAPLPKDSNAATNDEALLPSSQVTVGIINLAVLQTIYNTLRDSVAEEDIDLAQWIQDNYFTPPIEPHEEGRAIYTNEGFFKLYNAYKRAQSLSNNTTPEKWPFFTGNWKEMSHKVVKQKAKAIPEDELETNGGSQSTSLNENTDNIEQGIAMLDATDPGAPLDLGSTPPSVIAAHSDPVITNLDSWPPSANKRKSDAQDGQNKKIKRNSSEGRGRARGSGRGRGRRGGRGGRSPAKQKLDEDKTESKAEVLAYENLPEPSEHPQAPVLLRKQPPNKDTSSVLRSAEDEPSPSLRTTRSKTKKGSGATLPCFTQVNDRDDSGIQQDLDESVSHVPTPEPDASMTILKKLTCLSASMTSHEGLPESNLHSLYPHHRPANSVAGAFKNYGGPDIALTTVNPGHVTLKPADPRDAAVFHHSNTSGYTQGTGSSKGATVTIGTTGDNEQMLPSPNPIWEGSGIQFFARVSTPTKNIDLLLPEKSFTGNDVDMIKQYAEWKQQEEGIDLTYEQFVKIRSFAKQN